MFKIEYAGMTIEQLRKTFAAPVVDKALARTLNRTADGLHSRLSRELRARYAVKAGDISKTKKIDKALATGKTDVVLQYIGRRLPLHVFSPKSKEVRVYSKKYGKKIRRRAVSVKILKGERRKTIQSVPAFLVKNGTQIRSRRTAERESYGTPTTLSLPELILTDKQRQIANEYLADRLPREFVSNMEFYLSKLEN